MKSALSSLEAVQFLLPLLGKIGTQIIPNETLDGQLGGERGGRAQHPGGVSGVTIWSEIDFKQDFRNLLFA